MTLLAVVETKDLKGLQSDGIMGLPPTTTPTSMEGSVKSSSFMQ